MFVCFNAKPMLFQSTNDHRKPTVGRTSFYLLLDTTPIYLLEDVSPLLDLIGRMKSYFYH